MNPLQSYFSLSYVQQNIFVQFHKRFDTKGFINSSKRALHA